MVFPLYTDADVHGPVVDALRRAGWDVMRAIDAFSEGTGDSVHFERAAKEGRVFVPNDRRILRIAHDYLKQARPFRMVTWPRSHYDRMTGSDFVRAFEALARRGDPFPRSYPIIHLKPGA